jgi:hypothetical protein
VLVALCVNTYFNEKDSMVQTCSPFVSYSVSRYLVRGCGAPFVFAIVASVLLLREGGPRDILEAIVAGIVALILLRGCPTCWLIGLFETIAIRSLSNNHHHL